MSMSTDAPNPTTTMTREAWLLAAADALWPKVVAAGGERPRLFRASCGWPSKSALRAASRNSRRIGECWSGGSEDEAREVFVSPALAHPVEVMDVLLHEMLHAALPAGSGHGPAFQRLMKRVGLSGKPTSTYVDPESELCAELKGIAADLGRYPHARLDAEVRPRQATRMMKGECPDCGYVVRLTRTWIEVGMPTCPCGSTMVSVEYEPEGETLKLESATVSYLTEDGHFSLRTTKTAGRDGKWLVTHLSGPGLPWTIRYSRADALAFIAAFREGLTNFPAPHEHEEHEEELEPEDDLLDDDEEETPDYPQDQVEDVLGEALYERQLANREGTWTPAAEAAFLAWLDMTEVSDELRRTYRLPLSAKVAA